MLNLNLEIIFSVQFQIQVSHYGFYLDSPGPSHGQRTFDGRAVRLAQGRAAGKVVPSSARILNCLAFQRLSAGRRVHQHAPTEAAETQEGVSLLFTSLFRVSIID